MGKLNRRNYYRILHVQPDAPTEVIKASYRTLMLKLGAHPDHGGDVWNAAVINEAHRVLTDSALRREYDRQLRNKGSEVDPLRRRAPSGPAAHSVPHPPRRYRAARKRCLFCGTEHASGIPGYSEEARCRTCNSPLARVATRLHRASERRAVKRIALQDDIPFYTAWPQSTPFSGRVIDASPQGMQFVATQALQPNQMIKLEGRGLSAVARVVRCSHRANHRGDHRVGVQFATLAIKTRRTND
jgi:hypothetical protein